MKILVINGPNLDMLRERDSKLYGCLSLEEIELLVRKHYKNIEFEFFQSAIEGELINKINKNDADALIVNLGGYSHTSVALKDALEICKKIKIEVHLSNLASREGIRHTILTASSCDGYICGFKEYSYLAAVYIIVNIDRYKSNVLNI